MELTFVTSNRHKLSEIREILRPFGITLRWSRRDLPEPQASSLEAVVRAKLAAAGAGRRRVLVEDSGLFIRVLGGFPGVYSRPVYETIGLAGVLAVVRGKDRRAVFRTVAGVQRGRRVLLAVGETEGSIARAPRGLHGFGYDPIFIPKGHRRTFAEMPAPMKNRLSHRGRALRSIARRLSHR